METYSNENSLSKAYAEVDKILSFMEFKYVEKIPYNVRQLFKREKLTGYIPEIDKTIPLDEQNLQRKTLAILTVLNLKYWCETEEEKQSLIEILKANDDIREEDLREKYNPDKIFEKKE